MFSYLALLTGQKNTRTNHGATDMPLRDRGFSGRNCHGAEEFSESVGRDTRPWWETGRVGDAENGRWVSG